jgi:hypothetical protein
MDTKFVRPTACGLLLLVGTTVITPTCHKPEEDVENMPNVILNVIMVGEANLQVTNTSATTLNYTYMPGRG